MKNIFTALLAAILLVAVLSGCARDMSGENRTTPAPVNTAAPTASARPTDGAVHSAAPTDSTADGVIDAGKDAVDGVVGAGEDAVNDVVDAAEDAVDELTGADSTAKPIATPKSTATR